MTRGELFVAPIVGAVVDARPAAGGWRVTGRAPSVDNAVRAQLFLVRARLADGAGMTLLVPRAATTVGPPHMTLGGRGLESCDVGFDTPVTHGSVLGDAAGAAERVLRLGTAAIAVGLAQAAFEAALRYSQQRTTFGQPICQHQAIQLKLADMATGITASRLLVYDAAETMADVFGDERVAMAKLEATETAYRVALESMRIHGGYGYTAEFPIERYYRDAARLLVMPTTNDDERRRLAAALVDT
ncbi:MAG: acyl-CoA dehydrogenase [Candidatus Rokubacteria bacterium]|nr:acyl-CoA dehydrogenase [Candidatus Rokubacteria bacterium]